MVSRHFKQLTAEETVHVTFTIRPRIREDEAAVRTRAWVKMFDEYSPPRVGLYAEVMYGGHSVVNAHVTAHVYQNYRNVATIILRDTGGGNFLCLHIELYFLHVSNASLLQM